MQRTPRDGRSVEFLWACSDAAKQISFGAGEVVHDAADPADYLYLIENGEIRLYDVTTDGTSRLLEILGQHEWFGSAVLGQLPTYGKRTVAVTPSVVWALPADDFLRELSLRGDLAIHFLKSVTRRLMQSWSDGSRLAYDECSERLIRALLKFSTSPAAQRTAEGVVLHITHAELAQAVGTARETVSVSLTRLRRRKLVQTGRNRLIFDPEKLRQLGATSESEQLVTPGGRARK